MSSPAPLPPEPPPGPAPAPRRPGVTGGWVAFIAGTAGLFGLLLGVLGTLVATHLLLTGAGEAGWPGAGPASQRLPERLPALVDFVENRVQAKFSTRPVVEVLGDADFDAALAEPSDAQPQSPEHDDFAATALALGLIDDRATFTDELETWSTEAVVGFYDPASDRLAVRGGAWSPLVETTVVHELVHALQDQHADLDAATRATRTDDESYLALRAVAEGQATVIEEDWLAEQTGQYQQLYEDAHRLGPGSYSDEPLVDVLAALPYDLGWDAVYDLELVAGAGATLPVLRDPPTTLEQVWDLTAWRDRHPHLAAATPVATPTVPGDERPVDTGTLGVHLLTLLTLDDRRDWFWLEDGPLPGWAGDRYVTWKQGSGGDERTCTRVRVVLDDEPAAAEAAGRLRLWSAAGGEISTERPGQLLLERCQ